MPGHDLIVTTQGSTSVLACACRRLYEIRSNLAGVVIENKKCIPSPFRTAAAAAMSSLISENKGDHHQLKELSLTTTLERERQLDY
jgi:hypothetical protein